MNISDAIFIPFDWIGSASVCGTLHRLGYVGRPSSCPSLSSWQIAVKVSVIHNSSCILKGLVTTNLDEGFLHEMSAWDARKKQERFALRGIYWQTLTAIVDDVMATAFSIISAANTFSPSRLIVVRTNIWIEMPSILREDFICWMSVFHVLRDGDMSETATLIPNGAKNDIAHSQCCTQHPYVPTILDVSTNISHMGRTGGCLFCLPLQRSTLTRISCVFFVSHVATSWSRWETWTPVCKQWLFGQLEGHFTF